MKTFQVPELAWYDAKLREYELPAGWRAVVSCMNGHHRMAMTSEEIAAAICHPIGCEPLHSLARPDSRVGIVFDDMSRVTRCKKIVPPILAELDRAGVPDSNIRFIGATGCHRAMNHEDFVKKLGEIIPERFAVYSHNAFGDCVSVGTTSQGIEISVNAELMSCNLKIAIGSVVPHRAVGFSGGPKTILPGVCSVETVKAFHQYEIEAASNVKGSPESCYPAAKMCEEAVRLVGLDFKIDAIINSYGDTAALYAGRPEASYKLAREDARNNYLSRMVTNAGVVIANTYAKANEFESGLTIAYASVAAGGDIVLIANTPDGHIPHYLFGSWSSEPQRQHMRIRIPERVHRLYIFTEYPDRTLIDFFQDRDRVVLMKNWGDVLKELAAAHPDASAVIYPNADIQYAAPCPVSGREINDTNRNIQVQGGNDDRKTA